MTNDPENPKKGMASSKFLERPLTMTRGTIEICIRRAITHQPFDDVHVFHWHVVAQTPHNTRITPINKQTKAMIVSPENAWLLADASLAVLNVFNLLLCAPLSASSRRISIETNRPRPYEQSG